MPEPYIRRVDGDLISAEDWNAVQVAAREEIAAVDARRLLAGPDTDLVARDMTVRNLTVTGEARLANAVSGVVVGYMQASQTQDEQGTLWRWPRVRRYFAGGGWSGPMRSGVNDSWSSEASLFSARSTQWFQSWGLVPSPQLGFTLSVASCVLLRAEGQLTPSTSYDLWTQLVLCQEGCYAPARVNPFTANHLHQSWAAGSTQSSAYTAPCEPGVGTWEIWLKHFDALCDSPATQKAGNPLGWPVAGLRTRAGDGRERPYMQEEWVELPAGTYTAQLGFFTSSDASSAHTLRDLVLRALILPLGGR